MPTTKDIAPPTAWERFITEVMCWPFTPGDAIPSMPLLSSLYIFFFFVTETFELDVG